MAFVNKEIDNKSVTIDEERGMKLFSLGTNRENCTQFDFYWPNYDRPMRVYVYGKIENVLPKQPLLNILWTIDSADIPPKLMDIRAEVFSLFMEALKAHGLHYGRAPVNNITIIFKPTFEERVYGITKNPRISG
jgi:hypothetical protein